MSYDAELQAQQEEITTDSNEMSKEITQIQEIVLAQSGIAPTNLKIIQKCQTLFIQQIYVLNYSFFEINHFKNYIYLPTE